MPLVQRPNIVLALFDTLGTNDVDKHLFDMPALATLQRNSVSFLNAYTPGPQAGPARASLFTGLDPAVHGVWTDGVALAGHEQTFVQRLAAAGYRTWLVGRRQLAGVSHWTTEPARPGEFSALEWAHGPLHRSRQNAWLQWLQSVAEDEYTKVFPMQADPDHTIATAVQFNALAALKDELSFNRWVGERINSMISNRNPALPFLAVAGFVVGESMGSEPASGALTDSVNTGALLQADQAVGRLLDGLSENGIDKDTVVIVASARGHSNRSSHLLAEAAINVPLFIHVPDLAAGVVSEPVSVIDIAPTIINLAQIPSVARMQGQSLTNHKEGRGWSLSRVRSSTHGWQSAVRSGDYKLVVMHNLSADDNLPRHQLFNLASDPQEQINLAAQSDNAAMLEHMIDTMIDARCALEDRTEPRIAKF